MTVLESAVVALKNHLKNHVCFMVCSYAAEYVHLKLARQWLLGQMKQLIHWKPTLCIHEQLPCMKAGLVVAEV